MACQRLIDQNNPSNRPHEIVDASGNRRGHYNNKAAATRWLNRIRRDWASGSRPYPSVGRTAEMIEATENPFTFTVRSTGQ